MSIASVADTAMDEQQIMEMLEKYEDENGGGEGKVEFRRAMKLHLALLLQVVRNTDNLQGDVESLLRDIAKE